MSALPWVQRVLLVWLWTKTRTSDHQRESQLHPKCRPSWQDHRPLCYLVLLGLFYCPRPHAGERSP